MVGRTLLQHAPPITFGFKAAGWLEGLLDASAALDRFLPTAQLGGPVGTTAAYGARGPDVVEQFAQRLGLAPPTIAWHTARQRVADLGASLAILAATAAKVTTDVALLMQPEVGEAAEPAAPGRGRSSSVPGKRNPVLATEARAAAQAAGPLVAVLVAAVVAEHERPAGAWQAEWSALNDLVRVAGGATDRVRAVLSDIEVHTDAMAARVTEPAPIAEAGVWIDRVLARHQRDRR
jgi:3-carboxy-cis,cis-muconate cycloisomerase